MRRPIDVWVVGGYFALYAGAFAFIAIAGRNGSGPVRVLTLILGFVAAIIAGGVLALRNWARVFGIIFLLADSVATGWWTIELFRQFEPPFVPFSWIVFNLLVIAYLLRRKTRDLFTQRLSGQSSS